MPILFGPPIQPKSAKELGDATTFFTVYRQMYYGTSDVVGDQEMILMLIGYKNYLAGLYGLGATSPATSSAVVTGSQAIITSLKTTGFI